MFVITVSTNYFLPILLDRSKTTSLNFNIIVIL